MDRVTVGDVDRTAADDEAGRWRLSDPLGATDLALNRYRLAPGESLPGGLHAHADQEEVFVVLAGEATFETYLPGEAESESGGVRVVEDEAVRFAPGEFQSGRNDGDEELVVLALGAPRETADVRVPFACPECGEAHLRFDTDDGTFDCPARGVEFVPAPCPDCGSEALESTLDGSDEPVVGCRDCGATFDRPPVRE